jgi:hypothetical protein
MARRHRRPHTDAKPHLNLGDDISGTYRARLLPQMVLGRAGHQAPR